LWENMLPAARKTRFRPGVVGSCREPEVKLLHPLAFLCLAIEPGELGWGDEDHAVVAGVVDLVDLV